MRGKYSPTVSAAYRKNQNWFTQYAGRYSAYDPDGFDAYGYSEDRMDRAGNYECEYYPNDNDFSFTQEDFNWKYDSAEDDWGFDGTKPIYTPQ